MPLFDTKYLFDIVNSGSLHDILSCCPLGLAVDIDGTISEIAPTPNEAVVTETCRQALSVLARRVGLVAVISGRPVVDARAMVGVEGVVYVGNHGLEQWRNNAVAVRHDAARYKEKIRRSLTALARELAIDGLVFEDKGVTGAIHFRRSAQPDSAREAIIRAIERLEVAAGLAIVEGKMVIELRPPVELNKGVAIKELVEEHSLAGVIYLGDDLTDVNAFSALRELRYAKRVNSLSVAVLGTETPTEVASNADFVVCGVEEVERFLMWLVDEVGPGQ